MSAVVVLRRGVSMRIPDLLLVSGLLVPLVALCARGQNPASTTAARKDAPYHPSDFLKSPDDAKSSASRSANPATTSLATLTKIAILPSSISITGPHYNQRLVVEVTFLDGHQEDLTSRATLAISNPEVGTLN